MKQIINSEKAAKPIGPYNQAVMAGDTLYISGQIALDAGSGNLVNATVEEEVHQVMKNLGYVLAEAGLKFENVVKSTIFLKSMGDFPVVNQIYGSYFASTFPARETVEVSGLPKDVRVEISVIAVKD